MGGSQELAPHAASLLWTHFDGSAIVWSFSVGMTPCEVMKVGHPESLGALIPEGGDFTITCSCFSYWLLSQRKTSFFCFIADRQQDT